ncbi:MULTISPECIES: TetR/AcrR family transcriptional regulator [unclassified Parvimonas]|uniref:TetR/AcrR family transcriptional regulator n=1 Tax=unclassified Parvimonas TaxID=1151464 RepID=UPI002B472F2C|nr:MULTISPECIES: TetR/AcrR family transcriptional regulator [unclassified Parvimonas]MEB3024942.1 TetR/AcrR family transcriptional regulator [Parvimonas sp. M13]MEB3089295.1 TetR/AcrR family transcriptional regulator [Parvimonas sp. M20]
MRNERLPAEERKWQIRYAAKNVFLRKGFHNTTMEDVISESGMSKGGVYRYYKSISDMLFDLMEDGCEYRYNIVDNFLTSNKNLDKYDAVAEMMTEKILDDNELSKVYVMFLQEKQYDENLEKLFLKLKEETFIELKKIYEKFGFSFNYYEYDFLTDFMNSLVLGREILSAKNSFLKNRLLLKKFIREYLENSEK